MQVDKLLEILLNLEKQHPMELLECEKEEILIGQDKMQAIIAHLVEDTVEQAKELTNVKLVSNQELPQDKELAKENEEEIYLEEG